MLGTILDAKDITAIFSCPMATEATPCQALLHPKVHELSYVPLFILQMRKLELGEALAQSHTVLAGLELLNLPDLLNAVAHTCNPSGLRG